MKLNTLIDKVLEIIKMRGYKEDTWKHGFRNGKFSSLRQYFEDKGMDAFDVGIAREYIAYIQMRHENGKLSYSRCAHLKKVAAWFIEVYETGDLQWKTQHVSKFSVNEYYKTVLTEYIASKGDGFSKGSAANLKSVVLQFLDYLQNTKGYADFSGLVKQDAHDFVEFISPRYKSRLGNVVYLVKSFLAYLFNQNIVNADMSLSLRTPNRRRVRVLPCFSRDEANRILAQPNRNTPIGMRNFAILILAKDTGLRRGDIVNLKITDIDWRNGNLTITQNKTRNPLTLPLKPETEGAIAHYILNARPKSESQNVFLRQYAPHNALSPQNVGAIFSQNMLDAGIEHIPYDGKSIHALRRSIASWMLDEGISLEDVSQILGHKSINSTKQYLSFDDINLKKCALSLCCIEVAKEGLF